MFQAPQPVRPRTNGTPPPVDPMDIDSPFLDLFSGTAPRQTPASEPPPDDPDADFDFGFDFDGEDARRAAPPTSPAAASAPAAPAPAGPVAAPAGPVAAGPAGPEAPPAVTPPPVAPPPTAIPLPASPQGTPSAAASPADAPSAFAPPASSPEPGPAASSPNPLPPRDPSPDDSGAAAPASAIPLPGPSAPAASGPVIDAEILPPAADDSPAGAAHTPPGQRPESADSSALTSLEPTHTRSLVTPPPAVPPTAVLLPGDPAHRPGARPADAPVSPFTRAPVGPEADFYDEALSLDDWPDDVRPSGFGASHSTPPLWQRSATTSPAPGVHEVPPADVLPGVTHGGSPLPIPAPGLPQTGDPIPVPAPGLSQTGGPLSAGAPGVTRAGGQSPATMHSALQAGGPLPATAPGVVEAGGAHPATAPGVFPVGALSAYPSESEPDHHAELAPMPEKAPARKWGRKKKDEPANLPAVREKKDLKPAQLRPHKLKFSDRDPAIELEISEIAGHLTFTQSTVTAWYSLPEVRWAFRPDAEREALLSAISEQYAGLAGFRLHLRRTNRPFPADEWARTVDSLTAKPLPDVSGSTSWSDHLVAAQRHLLSVNHAEGQTYLGVTFARRSLGDTFSERILRIFGKGTSDSERRKLGRTVEQFDEVLNAFGMRGRRVTPQELEWLLFRSVALCMAPPGPLSPVSNGHWERGDLLALTEQVERYRTPYGSTVKLVNRMTGEERHVAVLSVGRMEPLEIPEKHEPWMHFHERLPWPMELSSRIDILGPNSSFKNLEHRLRMIRSQQLDYAEHGIDAPPELERLAKRALVIGDEMTTGLPVESARAHGWHRIAVGGRTREECLERARRLIQLYSRELRISLQHPKNQDQLAREFIPGEPIANTGYVRRMPVKLLAAALPQAASTVGDRRGDLIGRTAGTCRRPVFLDLHFPMEVRERSGLGVFVAEPGGGKSTLMGALGYLNARRGVQVTLLDPSGPLARLCQMPELRPYSRVLNLTGSEQGTLAPYALIPTPVRTEFATGPSGDREYEIAVSNARAERRMLVQDICSMLVPPQVAKEASTATLLRHAVRQVPAEETSTLDDVVATLQGLDDEGKELANLLLDTAEMPLALLFFGRPPAHLLGADSALTVITMAGLRLPDLKIEREYWSAEESLALPMLHTAHRLAVRRCYGGSMSSRKMVGLDEAHFMEGWRSGRSFLVRLARDSRKWNLAALVASQNPRDILGLDVQNLVSTVFVGRIAEDQEIASEALRLLRVPVHDGYEATLASLSQADISSSARLGFREFVMRDVDGRVQKVRVDVSYVEGLLDHLDTTPAAAKAAPTAIPSLSDLEV
ncbi:ATP-binding protein [Actinoplanes sp. NPDC051475]|uniref:ATP-binding protein n=1 Tax=Actinoplanes sp. NPDC051475 TaxID=3157225 RepID=UPI00344B9437